MEGYVAYVAAYELYVLKLAAAKASWKQQAKDDEARVKAASAKGEVVKKTFSLVSSNHVTLPAKGPAKSPSVVPVSLVKVSYESVPALKTEPKPSEAKLATKVAKRRRNRKNRALRKAKQLAELTVWQLRVRQNEGKLSKYRPSQEVFRRASPGAKGKAPQVSPEKPIEKVTEPSLQPRLATSQVATPLVVAPRKEGGASAPGVVGPLVGASASATSKAPTVASGPAPSSSKKAKAPKKFANTKDGIAWASGFVRSQFDTEPSSNMMAHWKKIDWTKDGVRVAVQEDLKKTISAALKRARDS